MKPGRKRKLVDVVRSEWRISIRRACRALEVDRSTYHYKSRRSGQAAIGPLSALALRSSSSYSSFFEILPTAVLGNSARNSSACTIGIKRPAFPNRQQERNKIIEHSQR